MNSMVKTVDNSLMNYQIPEAARSLQEFVDDLSNWYVRRSRERFWAKGMEQDKINAFMTLYTALVTVAKAAAPMIPFMTEQIYQNIVRKVDGNAPESVHLCDFPEVNESWIDTELESDMDEVLKVVVMGRAARNAANIKNRQPIARMYVKADHELSKVLRADYRGRAECEAGDFLRRCKGIYLLYLQAPVKDRGTKVRQAVEPDPPDADGYRRQLRHGRP